MWHVPEVSVRSLGLGSGEYGWVGGVGVIVG